MQIFGDFLKIPSFSQPQNLHIPHKCTTFAPQIKITIAMKTKILLFSFRARNLCCEHFFIKTFAYINYFLYLCTRIEILFTKFKKRQFN